ncbi:MAG: phosphomannomutase/phosphoglucomutase [Rickettsiales bacterium]|jgi:phosphomannomutase|nr:phosphomannomutase/phosphoglucomutase [Rickettsiales bacterium]
MTSTSAVSHTTSHRFSPSILREYDIRGIVGETLSVKDAYALGQAFGTYVQRTEQGNTICVARDGRESSPLLEDALVEGLMSTGAEVIRLGLGPTPMLYFGTHTLKTHGGIMVTGSHNPPSHNGFKMLTHSGSLYGQTIQALGKLVASNDLIQGKGSVREQSVKEQYLDSLVNACNDALAKRPLKVAWDAGNGAGGQIMEQLCAKLPGKHFPLFAEIDGTFPNHHPDPTVAKNLESLIATVKKEGCDLGVAFDGDADRVGVVDHKGRIVWGDQLMVLLSRDVLSRHPGATIIADVKASQILFDDIKAHGGNPLMWRTGHSLVKAKMKEVGAPLAGEMSGHIFFAEDYFGFDDGLYAAVRLLKIASQLTRPIADIIDELPRNYSTEELRIPCSDERKFALIDAVKEKLSKSGANVNTIDGVRVLTEDGWWLLRASNTQAVLVARCESPSEAGLKRLETALNAELAGQGVDSSASASSNH